MTLRKIGINVYINTCLFLYKCAPLRAGLLIDKRKLLEDKKFCQCTQLQCAQSNEDIAYRHSLSHFLAFLVSRMLGHKKVVPSAINVKRDVKVFLDRYDTGGKIPQWCNDEKPI